MAKKKSKPAAAPAPAAKEPGFRDRIVRFDRVDPALIDLDEENWRQHPIAQVEAFRGVLKEIGICGVNAVRELPGGRFALIDGEMRTKRYRESGNLAPILVLDLTAAEAKKMLLTFDPIAAMAEADAAKLDSLMRDVETGSQELADMLTALAKEHEVSFTATDNEGGAAPAEDENGDGVPVEPSYAVVVECSGEEQQQEVFERLTEEGFKCRVLTL